MKKRMKRISIAMIAIFLLICSFVACATPADSTGDDSTKNDEPFTVKNVVLMIGDGMGPNHIRTTADYYGEELYMEKLAYADGLATTYSANSDVTDSAAAATALSCGVKTTNGQVAMKGAKKLTNMTEYMHSIGKRVGIVATEGITGATPAGFSAHAADRSMKDEILSSQIAEGGADLYIGADSEYMSRRKNAISTAGYEYLEYVTDLEEYSPNDGKFFVSVEKFNAYGDSRNGLPFIDDAAVEAYDLLNKENEDGFFLMVEASHIDKYAHSNDLSGMMKQVKQFDIAIQKIVEKAGQDGDTLVIVTADHETGDLQYSKGDEFTNALFHSSGHTGQDVRYFLYGKEGLKPEPKIDNTDICNLIRTYIETRDEALTA